MAGFVFSVSSRGSMASMGGAPMDLWIQRWLCVSAQGPGFQADPCWLMVCTHIYIYNIDLQDMYNVHIMYL